MARNCKTVQKWTRLGSSCSFHCSTAPCHVNRWQTLAKLAMTVHFCCTPHTHNLHTHTLIDSYWHRQSSLLWRPYLHWIERVCPTTTYICTHTHSLHYNECCMPITIIVDRHSLNTFKHWDTIDSIFIDTVNPTFVNPFPNIDLTLLDIVSLYIYFKYEE